MKRLVVIFSTALLLAVQSCSVLKSDKQAQEQDQERDVQTNLLEKERLLIKATQHRLLEEPEKALAFINEAVKRDSADFALFYERAKIYMALNDFESAYKQAHKAWKLSDTNRWAGEYFASLNLQNDMYQEAILVYQQLRQAFPKQTGYYLRAGQLLEHQGNYEKAIDIYQALINLKGISEKLARKVANMQLEIGRNEEAFALLNELRKSEPANVKYQNLFGEFYLKAGQKINALKAYKKALAMKSDNGQAHAELARIYLTLDSIDQAFKHIRKTFQSNQLDAGEKISYYKNFYEQVTTNSSYYQQSHDVLTLLEAQHSNSETIKRMLANFYFKHDKLKQARDQLIKVLDMNKNDQLAWNRLFEIDLELDDYKSLYKHTNEALNYYVNYPVFYFYNGLSAYFTDRYQEAVQSLKDAKSLVHNEKYLEVQINTFLGEAYYELGEKKEAYSYYEQALEKEPDNEQVLNNYGYYLALDSTNLDKAEKMVRRVIDRHPNSHIYLDTFAWIKYQQGQYEKALQYIEAAHKNGGSKDADILEHYGDILFRLGNEERAKDFWEQALQKKEDSDILEKKIEQGLPGLPN